MQREHNVVSGGLNISHEANDMNGRLGMSVYYRVFSIDILFSSITGSIIFLIIITGWDVETTV